MLRRTNFLHRLYRFEAACVPLMVHHRLYISALRLITSAREAQDREPGVATRQHNTAGVRALLLWKKTTWKAVGCSTPRCPSTGTMTSWQSRVANLCMPRWKWEESSRVGTFWCPLGLLPDVQYRSDLLNTKPWHPSGASLLLFSSGEKESYSITLALQTAC